MGPRRQIIDEISSRSKDIIMGVGERLSCRIVTAVLRDRVSTIVKTFLEIRPADRPYLTGYRRRASIAREYRRDDGGR